MIRIHEISKNFKENKVLSDVSFNVDDGEIVGLLGENGAGKSTLLRILSTMIRQTKGVAQINGFELGKQNFKVRESIGILFGNEVGLYEKLTVKENLYYFVRLNGMDKNTAAQRIDQLAKELEFSSYIDKYIYSLSRGMKQKVSIARAIIHDPNVILLDEPDAGLDFSAAKIIFDFLIRCKNSKKAIIFSSHSMENIKSFSDRVIVLHKGQIRDQFSMTEYRGKYTSEELNNILYNMVVGGG